jgi:hypothetical protein
MVDGVHRRATNVRADTLPAVTTCLSFLAELVLIVRRGADRCPAVLGDLADFGGRHLEIRVSEVVGNELDEVSCGAGDLCTSFRLDLDVISSPRRE